MVEMEELSSMNDLLEPQMYPDPTSIRISLANTLTAHEQEMINQITSNKATLRAIAPYLQILAQSQKKHIETKVTRKARVPKITFARKSVEKIGRFIPNVMFKPDLMRSIFETADTLKDLIRTDGFVVYFVDPEKNEIFQSFTENRFEIKAQSTMAGYTAFIKHHIISEDVRADERFPLGLGIDDTKMKYGLCVPIKTPDENVVALFELTRDDFDVQFDNHDVKVLLTTTSWIGVGVFQHFKYNSLIRQRELVHHLQELVLHYHCKKTNFEKAMSDIIIFAREILGAEECVLYVVVGNQEGKLEIEEYVEDPANFKCLIKKVRHVHLESDDTVLAKVIMGKQIANTQGEISLICVPVSCTCNKIIATIELKNIISKRPFNEEEEKTLQLFANYFSLVVPFVKRLDRVQHIECQGDAIRQMLLHHIKPAPECREVSKRKSVDLPEEFFTFSWYPSPDDMPLLTELTVTMLSQVLGCAFMIKNNVPRFVSTVKNCYRPNAYHNFLHAFVVAHTMANIVKTNYYIFTGIERQALMVAALCHDVDHRGYNNSFVQLTNHYLSALYESSPLENHHFSVTKMIIEQCSMFKHLSKDIYNQILEEIHKCILATDLSFYFQTRTELVKIADKKAFSFKDYNHRHLIKSLLMTTCDLSGQSKPIDIAMKITKNVYEEFFQQGDVEKKLGYTPLPTMDRDKEDTILDNQIQFLNVVVVPCVEIVARIFGSVHPMLEDTRDTLNKWRQLQLTNANIDGFFSGMQ